MANSCAVVPVRVFARNKTLRGLSTPSLDRDRVQKAFTSHRVPFHFGCPGDAHTAAHLRDAIRSIPAPSCSPNLRRPAKCDETTPCRTEAGATRHWSRLAPGRITRSRLLLAPYFARRQKDASQNGIRLRIVCRCQGVRFCATRSAQLTPSVSMKD
jgi:hypothetical protein